MNTLLMVGVDSEKKLFKNNINVGFILKNPDVFHYVWINFMNIA